MVLFTFSDKNKSAQELRREREEQTKLVMKKLEAKYAALQVSNVVTKLGTSEVCRPTTHN